MAAILALAALAMGLLGIAAHAQPQPRIRTLTEQEAIDLMVGTAITGTRASDTAQMIDAVKELMAKGQALRLIAPQDLPGDWTVAQAAGGIGGGEAWAYVVERTKAQNLTAVENPALEALKRLERHTGRTIQALVRNESAGATLSAFRMAIATGLPVVDACPAGRAKPEVQHSLTYAANLPITPAVLMTRWGDIVIIDNAVDDYRYEDIARSLAVASGGGISNARGLISGRDLTRTMINGALSREIAYGRTVREAKAQGGDPVAALVKAAKGYLLFQGRVTTADHKRDRGFAWWDVTLAGSGAFAGHTYRIFVKNENIVSWLDGKPDAMAPDLIYNVDPATGYAATAPSLGGYAVGAEIAIVGEPAPSPLWRSPRAIEAIGPRHFGFDFDYVPIEELQRARPALAAPSMGRRR